MPSASEYRHHVLPPSLFLVEVEDAEEVERLELAVDGGARLAEPPPHIGGR